MTTLRRFLVVQAFAVWQGGFVFYSAVVVPVGTGVLGSAAVQGEITRPVTDWLNLLGGVWAAVFLWELLADADPSRPRRRLRWLGWAAAVGLLAALALMHLKLDSLFDEDGRRTDVLAFRRWHIAYLWASTVHWLLGLLLAWLTVRAWGATTTPLARPPAPAPADPPASTGRCPPPGR